jgi:hypothetical protein
LVVHSCIVSLVGISPYGDGYLLACPDSQAYCIAASKPTHDGRVVIVYAADVVVRLVEAIRNVVIVKGVGHFVVKGRIHRPILYWLRLYGQLSFHGRLLFSSRRRGNGWVFKGLGVNSGVLVVLCQSLVAAEMAIACCTVELVCG